MVNELPSKTKDKLCISYYRRFLASALYIGGGSLGLVLLIVVIVLVLRR